MQIINHFLFYFIIMYTTDNRTLISGLFFTETIFFFHLWNQIFQPVFMLFQMGHYNHWECLQRQNYLSFTIREVYRNETNLLTLMHTYADTSHECVY